MSILDFMPLLSLITGMLLTVFIAFRKYGLASKKRLKIVLTILIFCYTYVSLDYYMFSIGVSDVYIGGSYMFFHMIGFLFCYFVYVFINRSFRLLKWIVLLLTYTIFRLIYIIIFFPTDTIKEYFANYNSYSRFLEIEYAVTVGVNIVFMVFAYIRLIKAHTCIKLDKSTAIYKRWLVITLLCNIVVLILLMINSVVYVVYKIDYISFIKMETLLYSMLMYALIFSMLHFPVFVYTGNYNDLSVDEKRKYSNSNLIDSEQLYIDILQLVKSKELYLEYGLKMNIISDELGKTVHHVSQAINQNSKMNFPDFINKFRVDKAKELLLKQEPNTIFAIALDVGFNSKATFYNAFKKFTGQTPTEFRKLNM